MRRSYAFYIAATAGKDTQALVTPAGDTVHVRVQDMGDVGDEGALNAAVCRVGEGVMNSHELVDGAYIGGATL